MLTESAGCHQLSSVKDLDSQSGVPSSGSLSILHVVTTFDPVKKNSCLLPSGESEELKREKTGQEEPGFSYI